MSAAPRDDAYISALEAENDELREKIRGYEEMLGFRVEIPKLFALTASEEKVLGFLMKREVATKEQILHTLYADRPDDGPDMKIVDVFICKVRKKVLKFGIAIETHWGKGYSLTPTSKAIIKQFLTPEPVA